MTQSKRRIIQPLLAPTFAPSVGDTDNCLSVSFSSAACPTVSPLLSWERWLRQTKWKAVVSHPWQGLDFEDHPLGLHSSSMVVDLFASSVSYHSLAPMESSNLQMNSSSL
ncbi:hypothetical protein DsansV1_C02g0018881 [Dioscorea sansibarensis]